MATIQPATSFDTPGSLNSCDIEVQDGAHGASPNLAGRCKKLQRRTRWAICCGITALVLAIAGLIGVFVIGPSIAKAALDRSVITFNRLNLTRVVSNTSVMAAAEITVSNVAPLGCDIGELDMEVMYEGQPFASLTMPPMSVSAFKDNHISLPPSLMKVTDFATWVKFSSAMLRKRTVTWRLRSSAKITAGVMGLSMTFSGVPFDKEIPLTCFNGMDDVQMDVFDMSKSTPGSLVVNMKVCLNNPSNIVIMELGDLYFGVYYRGAYMGNVTSSSSSIAVPQNGQSNGACAKFGPEAYNTIQMDGSLHPADHGMADELISRYFSGKTSAVMARALSPRADSVALFNDAMQGLELDTDLNGQKAPLITGLDLLSMMLKPVDNDKVDAEMTATVHIDNPLGAHSGLQIFQVDMTMNMSYANGSSLMLIGTASTGNTTVPDAPVILGKENMTVPVPSVVMTLPDHGAALTQLAKDMIKKKTLSISIDGGADTVAQSSALGYKMNIAGVPVKLPNAEARPPLPAVIVAGMDGLKDVEILSYTIPGNVPDGTDGCHSQCGALVTITASVKNPAPFGLEVGTMNADIENADGVKIGKVTTSKLKLSPGSNKVEMTGKIAPADDTAISAAQEFFSNYLQNSAQSTKVVGIDAGDSPVKWLHDVVHGLELKTTFPGAGSDFSVMTDVKIHSMSMDFSPSGAPQISATIQARMQMPAGVDMSIIKDVKTADMQFDMIDPMTGRAVGKVTVPSAATTIQYSAGQLTATFSKTPLVVTDSNGFSEVIKELLLGASKEIQMSGTASPTAITNMGTLKLQDVPFISMTAMRGFNRFKDPFSGASLMMVKGLDVVGGQGGSLNLIADCQVTNPSNVAASLGAVSLELWTTDSVKLGVLHIDNFALGANYDGTYITYFHTVKAVYTPPTGAGAAAGRTFLSNFVMGKSQTVVIRGTAAGTSIDLLKPGLAAFSTTSTAPGLEKNRLLARSKMHLPNPIKPYDLPTELIVQNPLTADMSFDASHCEIYPCQTWDSSGTKCQAYFEASTGYYTPDAIGEVVPGHGQHTLKVHTVKLNQLLSPEVLKTFFSSAGGGSFIRLAGSMTLSVGGTSITVDYSESDVPICLVYPFHSCDEWMQTVM